MLMGFLYIFSLISGGKNMINLKSGCRISVSNDQFFQLGDVSSLGIIIIQRGYLIYKNKRFGEFFGYSIDEISNWKKREFYKIVHPDDLAQLTQKFIIADDKVITVRFRGIRKDGTVIPIENYICVVHFDDKKAMLCSYMILKNSLERNATEKINIKLPSCFNAFFDYLELNFGLNKISYLEDLIQTEIKSRNEDLNLF